MGDSIKERKKTKEISYQIGMKSGKIVYDDHGKVAFHQTHHALFDHHIVGLLERWIWKDAPTFPRKFSYVLLWILPIVSMLLTICLAVSLFTVYIQ